VLEAGKTLDLGAIAVDSPAPDPAHRRARDRGARPRSPRWLGKPQLHCSCNYVIGR
jgi:hypothetical protein